METTTGTYRKFLKDALTERCAKKPAYSLRAFAKHLGLSPSHLSRVMSGEKDLSPQAALRVASELKLKSKETELFLDLVHLESADETTRPLLLKRVQARFAKFARGSVGLESFKLIADWYHLPLLELIGARGFRSDAKWVSAKLGLSLAETKSALERLQSLGLIEITKDGAIRSLEKSGVETSDDISSAAIKRHHEQMSLKAIEAVKEQAVDEREFQSLHFAFEETQMKRAKEFLREFADRFEAEFKPQGGTDVFQLNLQFFRLTKKSKRKS